MKSGALVEPPRAILANSNGIFKEHHESRYLRSLIPIQAFDDSASAASISSFSYRQFLGEKKEPQQLKTLAVAMVLAVTTYLQPPGQALFEAFDVFSRHVTMVPPAKYRNQVVSLPSSFRGDNF